MTCDCINQIKGGRIIILPSGCLGSTEIDLQCKSADEAVFYQFSMANRMAETDRIISVKPYPSSSDKVIVVDQITISGQTFKCRISGGTLNTKVGIKFVVTTMATEILSFVATLPIEPSGIIGEGENGSYVIGNDGPQGDQGKAATITIGTVMASQSGNQPQITNIGTPYDAVLDFILPRGEKGEIGPQGQRGEKGDTGPQGIQGIQGEAGTQILTSHVDPTQKDVGKNLVWLNVLTGDLFETVPVSADQYSWSSIGNLKGIRGNAGPNGKDGSRIITSGSDPDQSTALANANNIWINTQSWNLWRTIPNDTGFEWIRIGNIKGDIGPQGNNGEAGKDGITPVITAGSTTVLETGQAAQVKSTTTGSTTVFDFYIPQGPKGDSGSRWYSGTSIPSVSTGLDDERGAPRPGDMYLYLDTSGHDASTYILTEGKTWAGPLATVAGIEGKPASITVGSVITGESGTDVLIENVGTSSDVVLNITIPRGDSYINDGTVDLNVKSITSDNELIHSDGQGNLQAKHLRSENNGIYTNTTDYSVGWNFYRNLSYVSMYGWKILDNRMFQQSPELDLEYEVFLRTEGIPDLSNKFSMNLLFDAYLSKEYDPTNGDPDTGLVTHNPPINKVLSIIGTEGVLGHDTVNFQGTASIDPKRPWYYGSRTLRINPNKLSDIKLNTNLGVSGITNNYLAGTIGLCTNYFTKSDDDTQQDGFVTPVIWDTDTSNPTQGRTLGVPYIPVDKKDTLPETANIEIGTQSFDVDVKKPCWWNGTAWVNNMGEDISNDYVIPKLTVFGVIKIAASAAGVAPVMTVDSVLTSIGIDSIVLSKVETAIVVKSTRFLNGKTTFSPRNNWNAEVILPQNVLISEDYSKYLVHSGNMTSTDGNIVIKIIDTTTGKYLPLKTKETSDIYIKVSNYLI